MDRRLSSYSRSEFKSITYILQHMSSAFGLHEATEMYSVVTSACAYIWLCPADILVHAVPLRNYYTQRLPDQAQALCSSSHSQRHSILLWSKVCGFSRFSLASIC